MAYITVEHRMTNLWMDQIWKDVSIAWNSERFKRLPDLYRQTWPTSFASLEGAPQRPEDTVIRETWETGLPDHLSAKERYRLLRLPDEGSIKTRARPETERKGGTEKEREEIRPGAEKWSETGQSHKSKSQELRFVAGSRQLSSPTLNSKQQNTPTLGQKRPHPQSVTLRKWIHAQDSHGQRPRMRRSEPWPRARAQSSNQDRSVGTSSQRPQHPMTTWQDVSKLLHEQRMRTSMHSVGRDPVHLQLNQPRSGLKLKDEKTRNLNDLQKSSVDSEER